MAGAQNPSYPRRLTRCRTGCLRCRIRRRKCDEGKPRCRNCIDRNFYCQYGSQLTFLTKNAHTVQPSDVNSPPASYEEIRFINEEPQNDRPEANLSQRASSATVDTTQQSSHGDPDSSDHDHVQTGEAELRPQTPEELSVHVGNLDSETAMFSDKDESAVAGLLALGTGMSGTIGTDWSLSDFAVTPSPREAHSTTVTTNFRHSDDSLALSPGHVLYSMNPNPEISPTETLELLRHYRYHIAPWLDLCDLGQSFGMTGLQLAMMSQPIWLSILALSDTSINQLHPRISRTGRIKAFNRDCSPDAQMDITAIALIRVLIRAKDCISNFSDAWSPQREYDKELLQAFSHHAVGRNVNSAIYWLFVRLDLGAALGSNTNLNVSLPLSFPYPVNGQPMADPFRMVFDYGHRALWLCARAIEFIHNEDRSLERPPLQTWMELVEELEKWYRERPQEFHPILELDPDGQLACLERSFPVVIFAHGAGVFGNQLYHTAMLVLLHNRPRTARISDLYSALMSPLWHARRICGIALQNDRRECWDPCLIASFLTAARGMTHEVQQQEILRGFERIRTLTGWDIGVCLQGLQKQWCLDKT